MKYLKIFFPIILIITIGLFGTKAFFHSGFYTSHDGEHQVIRLYQYDQALKDGQFPPRWAGTSDNGYGYPLFVFSYHAPWFIGIPLLRMGFSLTDSVKGIFIIGYLLSGLLMYFWLKEMLGKIPGFVGAFLYLWAPYRFSNLFVRASLGEATGFLFLPLIFWGTWEMQKKLNGRRAILLFSIGIAGVILSHLMMLIIIALPLFIWIILMFQKTENKKAYIKNLLAAVILGFGLSSYYLIPAVIEKKYTVANQMLHSYFSDHFVTLGQLLYSKWDYGFDMPGTINDGMSFQIGIAQWLVMGASAVVLVLLLRGPRSAYMNVGRSNLLISIYPITIFIYSIFMMLPVSTPLWKLIDRYAYFDFPWRFLSLAVFISAIAGAYLTSEMLKYSIRRGVLQYAPTILIIILALYTNRNHLKVNKYENIPDSFYINNLNTTNSYDEYRPKSVSSEFVKTKRSRLEKNPDLIIDKSNSKSNYMMFSGAAEKSTTEKINISNYPGWKIYVNGLEQKNNGDGNGMMQALIPQGKFTVEARFGETPLRIVADSITVGSLLGLTLFYWKKRIV